MTWINTLRRVAVRIIPHAASGEGDFSRGVGAGTVASEEQTRRGGNRNEPPSPHVQLPAAPPGCESGSPLIAGA